MVRITEDLVRRRAEHNEGEISSLEELSLHQQDIERIEHLDKWCRELRILYLQSNLIPRIENVGRLKKLQYLNLALNNIETIENLEGCESLEKLDLTVNFIGDILSLQSLRSLPNLSEIYLTGNPCCQFQSYRHFVVATLPQLKTLDGEDISRSERIAAQQNYRFIYDQTLAEQEEWMRQRHVERREAEERRRRWEAAKQQGGGLDDSYLEEKVAYTPESRMETHEFMQEKRRKENPEPEKPPPRQHPLFFPDGRPYNVNEAKVDFTLTDEDEQNAFVLDVAVFRHMDTSLVQCDVQPQYVRVTIKSKVLQLALPSEVNTEASTAKRSSTTGHLVVHMPKANSSLSAKKPQPESPKPQAEQQRKPEAAKAKAKANGDREFLEVDPSARKTVNVGCIAEAQEKGQRAGAKLLGRSRPPAVERPNSCDFVDDPDVPPLE